MVLKERKRYTFHFGRIWEEGSCKESSKLNKELINRRNAVTLEQSSSLSVRYMGAQSDPCDLGIWIPRSLQVTKANYISVSYMSSSSAKMCHIF